MAFSKRNLGGKMEHGMLGQNGIVGQNGTGQNGTIPSYLKEFHYENFSDESD